MGSAGTDGGAGGRGAGRDAVARRVVVVLAGARRFLTGLGARHSEQVVASSSGEG
jgi:hypothetical protein